MVPLVYPVGGDGSDGHQMRLAFTKGGSNIGWKGDKQEGGLVLWWRFILSEDDVSHKATAPIDQLGLLPKVTCKDNLAVTGENHRLGEALGLV